ncbi:pectinesterase family protein [Aureliella helgolandensis]|uniref:Pectinesterase A n=1 Tax=Aureliella helgolandensis TaxID=2527968 RepID=A0A518G9F5_9BACT|nr:pectinesterase family protein [Aureliella helgolandensis]QDV25200.1 Pectinesterase A precursor [Aureliella helgolandensis]
MLCFNLKNLLAGLAFVALQGLVLLSPAFAEQLVVAMDGSGDFLNVQDAIDAVPENSPSRTVIFIKPGIYKEKLRVPSAAKNLSLVGESYKNTILTFDDYAGRTSDYASTRILADDFYAQNLTFQNTIDSRTGIAGGQAAALRVDADRAVFNRCRIMGFQDTYYTGRNLRSYHQECIIEGTTDFIYGDGIALFEDCTIVNRRDSHITAHSQKLKEGKHVNKFGYVFQNCTIKKHPDEEVSQATLGRPWGNAARVVYLNCEIGPHVVATGWSPWRGRDNHQTAFYAEYSNRGPGSQPNKRLPWTRQLTEEEASQYTKGNIFKADSTTAAHLDGDWNPDVSELYVATGTALLQKSRVLVTSDGEIDDQCSMVRFLLYANEWDIEGIVTSSSQYHWHGHKWPGDDWVQPYLTAYAAVYPNLLTHDSRYPTAEFLQSRTFVGNVTAEGEMDIITPGSQHIVKVLLDESDDRPIWIQAWGGTNTIARALRTIEEEHPEKMAEVAHKIRFFFIWEQDSTYQTYIRSQWGKYDIPTIISDQFIAIFYHWKKYLPAEQQAYLEAGWMKPNILENHGPLCALYPAHEQGDKGFAAGDFRSEGDSPAFLHTIPTGLRSMESPGWGGWGGRYVKVHNNTWLDPVADPAYEYPGGRWYGNSAWGRERLRQDIPNDQLLTDYLKPIWRWNAAMQNDFASRADWCVKSFEEANHPPVVSLVNALNLKVQPGEVVKLSARLSWDPDGDDLEYRWWQYREAGTVDHTVEIQNARTQDAMLIVPTACVPGQTLHVICEVADTGTPQLTRYQRVVVEIE